MNQSDIELLKQTLLGQSKGRLTSKLELYTRLLNYTSWLADDAPPLERAYCAVHSLTQCPSCTECDQLTQWEPTKKKYSKTCGNRLCARSLANKTRELSIRGKSVAQHEATKAKRQATIEARYGSSEQFFTGLSVKRQATMQARYGVAYTASSPELRVKMQETCRAKYGVDNPLQLTEVRDKIQDTNKLRYGNEWHQSTEQGKQQRQNTCMEKYGVSKPLQSDIIRAKTVDTCIERYGVASPWQSETIRAKTNTTIRSRYGVDNGNQIHLSQFVLQTLDDPNWLIDQHHNQQLTLICIAEQLGVDPKTIGNRMKKFDIEIKRFGASMGEREVGTFLSDLGIEVVTNTKTVITPYELDIYLPDHNIAIEYCGLYWHSDIHPRIHSKYHLDKLEMCEAKGIRLITLFEDEWNQARDIVKQKLMRYVNKSDDVTINARQCIGDTVTHSDIAPIFDKHHIQGNGRGSINVALFKDGSIVAAMTLIRHKDDRLELNRYATTCNVRGGFSKLLKYVQRNFVWREIFTYADRRWSVGGLYQLSGFTQVGISRPSYFYLTKDTSTRIHRSHFQRDKLPNILENFDPALTEFENCDNNGVLRVWDCGLIKYSMLNK